MVALILASVVTQALGFEFLADYSSAGAVLKLFLGVAVLGFVNATLGRLLKLLTLPFNCLTLGLFSLLINAVMLFVVSRMDLGFKVGGFLAALVGSVLMGLFNGLLGVALPDKED